MAKSTLKKSMFALLAAVLAASLFFVYQPSASAKSVSVGSTLFTEIDNVTVTGLRSGLKLYSTGKRDTSAQYARKLYLKDFELEYKVTSADFSAIYFEILGENGSTATGTISDEDRTYRLTIEKKGDVAGVAVRDKAGEHKQDVPVKFTDTLTIKFIDGSSGSLKFQIVSGSSQYTIDKEISIYKYEGQLTIGFNGIQIGKAAEAYIFKLNGQKFTSTSDGYVDDDVAPVVRIDTDKITDTEIAPLGRLYELPIYGLDVISSTIKYSLKWEYSENADMSDAEELDATTENAYTFGKEGYYRLKELKVSDNNGNETTECVDFDGNLYDYKQANPIVIHVEKWSNATPEFISFRDDIPADPDDPDGPSKKQAYLADILSHYNGGATHKFQFAAPEVRVNSNPAGTTENPKLLRFKLKYRTVGSTSWSEVDGLVFTPTTKDKPYEFMIEVKDRQGNTASYYFDQEVRITFRDVTPPKISVSWFDTERYVDQEVTLPTASVRDDLDSSPETSVKVYYIMDEKGEPVYEKDEEGNILYEDEGQTIPKKLLVSESTTFTPDKLGWYEVIYSAKDKDEHETVTCPLYFQVVKAADKPREPLIDLSNTWNIVFLSIAGVCALGLIIIPFIKPKEE